MTYGGKLEENINWLKFVGIEDIGKDSVMSVAVRWCCIALGCLLFSDQEFFGNFFSCH
jgi:hypothetical protein